MPSAFCYFEELLVFLACAYNWNIVSIVHRMFFSDCFPFLLEKSLARQVIFNRYRRNPIEPIGMCLMTSKASNGNIRYSDIKQLFLSVKMPIKLMCHIATLKQIDGFVKSLPLDKGFTICNSNPMHTFVLVAVIIGIWLLISGRWVSGLILIIGGCSSLN